MVAPTLLADLDGAFLVAHLVDPVLAVLLQLAAEQLNEPHSYGPSPAPRQPLVPSAPSSRRARQLARGQSLGKRHGADTGLGAARRSDDLLATRSHVGARSRGRMRSGYGTKRRSVARGKMSLLRDERPRLNRGNSVKRLKPGALSCVGPRRHRYLARMPVTRRAGRGRGDTVSRRRGRGRE